MLGAVAGLASREGVRVEGADAVAVSFPGFFDVVDACAVPLESTQADGSQLTRRGRNA